MYGDNFDDGTGDDVEFYNGETAAINPGGWGLQHIEVMAVPDAAISGDVVVNVNGATSSNPLTFTVGECQTDPTDNCSVAGESCTKYTTYI